MTTRAHDGERASARRRAVGLLVAVAVVTGCTSLRDQRAADLERQAGGAAVHLLVERDDLVIGAFARYDQTCFTGIGGGQAGGRCMTAVGDGTRDGWAVELARDNLGRDVLYVAADPRVAVIKIPRRAGGSLEVVPESVAGLRPLLAVKVGGLDDLLLEGNTAQAFDSEGRLLGTTHNCEGLGGPADCGPYDGVLERTMPRPAPSAG